MRELKTQQYGWKIFALDYNVIVNPLPPPPPPPLVHPPTLSTPQQLYQQASIKCGFVSNLKLQKIWHFSISGKKDPKQPPPINGPNLVSSV